MRRAGPRRRGVRPAAAAAAALVVLGVLSWQNTEMRGAATQQSAAQRRLEAVAGAVQPGAASAAVTRNVRSSRAELFQLLQQDLDEQQQQLQGTQKKEAGGGQQGARQDEQRREGQAEGQVPAAATPAEQQVAAMARLMGRLAAVQPGDPLALSLPADQQLANAGDLAAFAAPNLTCFLGSRVPKVALLFLTTGEPLLSLPCCRPMPHEQLWTQWLRKMGGLLPKSALAPEQATCLTQCDGSGKCQSRCGPTAACNPVCLAELRRRYGRARGASHNGSSGASASNSSNVVEQQSLFSVYVHAPPAFAGYANDSIFASRIIASRVTTEWGTHSLAQATKNLVEEAVKDPDNEWFVLLSDTTIPLYPATLLWQQLMHENRSRIDACPNNPDHLYVRRATGKMNTTSGFRPLGPRGHWRKASQVFYGGARLMWMCLVHGPGTEEGATHAATPVPARPARLCAALPRCPPLPATPAAGAKWEQWFMLSRAHAELVAADREVNQAFAEHCRIGWDEERQAERDCISDEHYIPSLLAFHGQDNATTCHVTSGTFVDWKASLGGTGACTSTLAPGACWQRASQVGSWHPVTYEPGHVTKDTIVAMRLSRVPHDNWTDCSFDGALQAAPGGYVDVDKYQRHASAGSGGSPAAADDVTCLSQLGSGAWLAEDAYAAAALPADCNLMARKFSNRTADPVVRLFRNCRVGLKVLPCSRRVTEMDAQWWGRGRRLRRWLLGGGR
eukprot:scaffold7.g3649.t1